MTTTTPSGDVEARLAAALHARADQVTHDDLTTLLVPRAARGRRRPRLTAPAAHRFARAALTAGVAAAVAAIVAVPLLADGGTEPQPAPAPTSPAPSPAPSMAPAQIEQDRPEVTLDIDGDDQDDRAWIKEGDLYLEASSGTQVMVPVPAGSRLLPPVTDAGAENPLVVAVPPAGQGRGATLTFARGELVTGDAPESLSFGAGKTAWVDDVGALMIGDYDADVPTDQRVLVSAMVYRAEANGNLVEYGAGDLCWDRVTDAFPVDCTRLPAQDADPSLMFPVVETGVGIGELSGMFDGAYNGAQIVRRPSGALELEVTWDGVKHSARLPDSEEATLLDGVIAGGAGDLPAFVVSQEYADSTSFTVVAWWDGKYQAIPTADEGGWLASGYVDDAGQVFQHTWLSQSNVLWTARRIDPDEPDRYNLIRWSDKIGPTLVPVDEGEVCLDLRSARKLADDAC